jgi:3-phenylpropionate/cinnamic acid dioxygenase small subunit
MMNFILEQQAQFTVKQQLLQERFEAEQQRDEERRAEFHARYEAEQQLVRERITRLEENMAGMAQAQTEMRQAQTEMRRAQVHLSEVVAAMLDTHRQTEQRLEAFIGVLERYIAEDRNGRQ